MEPRTEINHQAFLELDRKLKRVSMTLGIVIIIIQPLALAYYLGQAMEKVDSRLSLVEERAERFEEVPQMMWRISQLESNIATGLTRLDDRLKSFAAQGEAINARSIQIQTRMEDVSRQLEAHREWLESLRDRLHAREINDSRSRP